jgi:hypothetical protein
MPTTPAGRADEVGDDENDRTSLHHRLRKRQQLRQIGHLAGRCAALRRRALDTDDTDSIEHMQHVATTVACRDDFIRALGKQHRTNAIAVAREQPRQYRDQFGRQHAFAHAAGTEVDRRGKVDQEPGRDLAILLELTHVRRREPRGDVPVDVTHVVVQLVFAEVGEVEAEAAEQRAVIALQQAVEPAQHGPFEPPQQAIRIDAAARPRTIGDRLVGRRADSGRDAARYRGLPRRPPPTEHGSPVAPPAPGWSAAPA